MGTPIPGLCLGGQIPALSADHSAIGDRERPSEDHAEREASGRARQRQESRREVRRGALAHPVRRPKCPWPSRPCIFVQLRCTSRKYAKKVPGISAYGTLQQMRRLSEDILVIDFQL
jgi:hypothetical protein